MFCPGRRNFLNHFQISTLSNLAFSSVTCQKHLTQVCCQNMITNSVHYGELPLKVLLKFITHTPRIDLSDLFDDCRWGSFFHYFPLQKSPVYSPYLNHNFHYFWLIFCENVELFHFGGFHLDIRRNCLLMSLVDCQPVGGNRDFFAHVMEKFTWKTSTIFVDFCK